MGFNKIEIISINYFSNTCAHTPIRSEMKSTPYFISMDNVVLSLLVGCNIRIKFHCVISKVCEAALQEKRPTKEIREKYKFISTQWWKSSAKIKLKFGTRHIGCECTQQHFRVLLLYEAKIYGPIRCGTYVQKSIVYIIWIAAKIYYYINVKYTPHMMVPFHFVQLFEGMKNTIRGVYVWLWAWRFL